MTFDNRRRRSRPVLTPRRRRAIGAAICLLFLFAGLARADFEAEVIELVNIERTSRGLRPLSYNWELAMAARLHSQDMADQNYVNHTSLDGREFFERIEDAGYDYATCGENIAAGFSTPAAVVQAWMSSDGHRANILKPDYCDIGVGYAAAAGTAYFHYWTQDFGRRLGVADCPVVAAAPPAGPDADLEDQGSGSGGSGGGCFIDSARP
jgi:hypothetical protein